MKHSCTGIFGRPAVRLLLVLAVPGAAIALSPLRAQPVDIIPRPASLTLTGGSFLIESGTVLYCTSPGEELKRVAGMFREEVRAYAGLELETGTAGKKGNHPERETGKGGKKRIILELEGAGGTQAGFSGGSIGEKQGISSEPEGIGEKQGISSEPEESGGPSPEGYRMSVNAGGIRISAQSPRGIFYGLKSLEQMILCADRGENGIAVPCVEIRDYPRYGWRGMHLDVSRHFFNADSVKRYIDFLALYKYNRFHWHLTDDQGWRIEIKKYPELTRTGAWRKPVKDQAGHAGMYGGFYTQEEIREVVRYASERYITVVPEIEMPGHSQAAIAAYPELGVTGKKLEVKKNWGISPNIYSPFQRTFDFLEDVLEEVMALFPSEYIHVGGDEAIKDQWIASPEVQGLIRNLGLKDEDELQSWFLQRIDSFLVRNGRKLIGWDEILEGGLPPHATVMSWRGTEGGFQAATLGHDVIMCPNTTCYFNFAQAENEPTSWAKRHVTKLEKVYAFEPCPPGLDEEQAGHILGAQGCIWTEHIETFRGVEKKLFPRITALSEVLWSTGERDLNGFMTRLKAQGTLFDKLNIETFKGDIN